MARSAKPGSRQQSNTAVKYWLQFLAQRCVGGTIDDATTLGPLDKEAGPAGGLLFEFLGYLVWAHPNLKGSTLGDYISSVKTYVSREHGVSLLTTKLFSCCLTRLKQVPTETLARVPATPDLIRRVASDSDIDVAVRTAVLLAWDQMLRAREYVCDSACSFNPKSTLQLNHVVPDASNGGFSVRIVHSKTDVYNAGVDLHVLPRVGDRFCPCRALSEYLPWRRSAAATSDPFFILRSGAYVTREDITRALKKHAADAGLPPDRITSHSIRIGGCFTLANGGVDWENIRVRGRWTDDSIMPLMYARMSVGRQSAASQGLRLDGAVADPPLFSRHVP